MNEQIIITGTGYCSRIEDYYATPRYKYDHPAYVIRRDGSIEATPTGYGQAVAIENCGPVLQGDDGQWHAVRRTVEGWRPIENAPAVPMYEFCTCKPYRGFIRYEYVGDRQQEALRRVLVQWLSALHIRFPWDNQLGELCPRAMAGRSGIYFASSFDKSRSDIHPQTEILKLIKSLAS